MALINCPNCGKSISSFAAICIHCGNKITTCPNCGKAVDANKPLCSFCGTEMPILKQKKSDEEKAKKNAEAIKKYSAQFENQYGKYVKGERIGQIGLGYIEPILFIVLAILSSFYEENEALMIASLSIYLIVYFGSAVVLSFSSFSMLHLCKMFTEWIERENLDVFAYLKTNLTAHCSWKSRFLISHAAFFKERFADKICSLVTMLPSLICSILAVIFIVLGILCDNDYVPFFVMMGVLMLILSITIYIIGYHIMNKHYDKWAWQLKEKFSKEAIQNALNRK